MKLEQMKKHKEALAALYLPVYLLWFFILERITPDHLFIVSFPLDKMIPFCEYFIVPYLLWFPYLFGGLLWLYFADRKDGFVKLASTLIVGLTICLTIYTFFPNAQALRVAKYPNNNIFTQIVAMLQGFDTPTNVCPSIHVFSTVAIHIAIVRSVASNRKLWIHVLSLVLAILICLSTVFLKQHSVFDVICAFILNIGMYMLFYVVLPHVRKTTQSNTLQDE